MNIFHLINYNIPIRLNDTVRLNKHNMGNIVMHVCMTITPRVCMFVLVMCSSLFVCTHACARFLLCLLYLSTSVCVYGARECMFCCAPFRMSFCVHR